MSARTRRSGGYALGWLVALGGALAGCGGDDSFTFPLGEGGADDAASIDGGHDATISDARPDRGADAKPGDDASDMGPDDATDDVLQDGASDTGADVSDAADASGGDASDSGAPDAADASDSSTGVDASDAAVCTNGSACKLGSNDDLCKNGVCSPCVDVTDDPGCITAYTGDAGANFICQGARCIPGDCHGDAQCAAGQICGATSPFFCGPCASDSQCKNDPTYGAGFICNTTQGQCVPSACNTPNATCAANPLDECCAISSSASACFAGNCCTNAQCAGATPACQAHVCTACGPVQAGTYYVDPIGGSDAASSTGSNQPGGTPSGACAFKTITHALAIIGAAPPWNTKVVVLGPSVVSLAANGETFPIKVPVNVVIRGQGTVNVSVTSGADGFYLAAPSSGLMALAMDGQSNLALHGVIAFTGSAGTTFVRGISTTQFSGAGIRAEGSAVLSIEAGTKTFVNGTNSSPAPGLRVTDTASAIISSTTDMIEFDSNTLAGIFVDALGSIKVTGTPGANGTGTVVARNNVLEGIDIAQTYAGAGPPYPPLNDIDGLVIWQSGRNGLRVAAGGTLKLRDSIVLGSGASGVLVTSGAASNDVTRVDLGNDLAVPIDYGRNVVQDAQTPNTDVGICLSLTASISATLHAAGNIFGTGKNCATTPAVLTRNACTGGSNGDIGFTAPFGANIITYQCTHP